MPEEVVTPAHQFPFDVPANFAALLDEELQTFATQLDEYSSQFVGLTGPALTEDAVNALEASATLAVQLGQEQRGRMDRTRRAAAFSGTVKGAIDTAKEAATFAAQTAVDPEPEPEPEVLEGEVQPAVTAASRRPSVREVARGTTAPAMAGTMDARSSYATMRASADVPHFTSGQQLTTFADAAKALSNRLEQYPTMTAQRARGTSDKRPVTVYDPSAGSRRLVMKSYTRHGGVQFARQFPEQLRVDDGGGNGYAVAEWAANERNLTAGNLIKSAIERVSAGRAITAAAAWCAPSEVIYELCELETLDGMLSVPELQTSRGGWQIPIDGGPDFASIWNSIGNAGNTHLTETQVQDDVAKVCTEIPCPDFEDVRLGVDYVCLTGGLLQRRGYPEIVARFSRGAMIALAHKINMGVIATIEAASGPAVVVPQVENGDDAAAALLSAVELAIVDTKYRNRMGFGQTIEVVMPMWFLAQVRAAMARRKGVAMVAVSDAEILDWFTLRKAVPQFVYDWQDAFSDLPTGPGGVDPLEALPTSGRFLTYPAGTWVKAVQDVVSLDTIYDSTNLQTNQYTAIFAEDGWAMLQMCPDSRVYEVALNPDGVVACCPPELVSL